MWFKKKKKIISDISHIIPSYIWLWPPILIIQSTILVSIVYTRHASARRPHLDPVDPELESIPGWLRDHLVVGRRARPNQRTEEGYPKPVSGKTFLILLKCWEILHKGLPSRDNSFWQIISCLFNFFPKVNYFLLI